MTDSEIAEIKSLIHTEILAFAKLLRGGLKEKERQTDERYGTDEEANTNYSHNLILETLQTVVIDEAERLKNPPLFTPAPSTCPKCGGGIVAKYGFVVCQNSQCRYNLGHFWDCRNDPGFVPYKDEAEIRRYNEAYYNLQQEKVKK